MFEEVAAQPDFAAQEEEVLAFWQREGIFAKSMAQNEGKSPYVIYDGPPTANAKPPLHTIVPMSFKDLVGRYQTMRGFYVRRQVGWDTHGLPVEVQVEKALGLAGKKEILNLVPGDQAASIRKFNEICRSSVWEYKQQWDKYVPRVGYWTDTERPYVTYEPAYVDKVWKTFRKIWDKELVYKGYKVVPFCPRCGTSLSAAEVGMEYQDVKDVSVFVAFPLTDRPERAILSWTTTPWTLPGNVGLAVGPDIDYVAVRQEEREYVLAKSRLEVLRGDYVILEEMKGSDLVGLAYQPPFPGVLADQQNARLHTVLPASFVTTEDGTGIVHTAVMYGEDDFNLGKQFELPMVHSVGPDGVFLERAGRFAGQYIRDALPALLTALQEAGCLYAKQTITHSYPFCWRCKTALIYYATDSWYIAMSTLKSELVRNNEQVQWYPAHIKDGRFGDFIREARDWAISRARFWGTPLPIWTSESGKYLCVGSIAELRQLAREPKLVGEDFDPHRPQVDEIVLVKDGEEYRREPFVMDVWFDSGAMPYASGREEKGEFPADYVAEAIDQTRGWFNSLLAISTIVKGGPAYRRVTCMGHLVDEHGKKMSKSGPNSVDPQEIFSTIGVDAVRWYLYTVNSPGEAKAFSIKDIQSSYRRSLLLLWNVFNYFVTYANVAGVEVPEEPAEADFTLLDRWMLSRQAALVKDLTAYMEDYDFMRGGRLIEEYIADLSTWYLRRSRKREDQAFFWTLYQSLLAAVTVLAPFTPFLTERMYRVLRRPQDPQSVHLLSWPEPASKPDAALEKQMQTVRGLVEIGLAARAQAKIKVRQPLAKATLSGAGVAELSTELQEVLAEELNVERVEIGAGTGGLGLELDLNLTDSLVQAGLARELLRQLQQLRKKKGLRAGEQAVLIAGADDRSFLEPLFVAFPFILEDAYLVVVPGKTWEGQGDEEIEADGRTLLVDVRKADVAAL